MAGTGPGVVVTESPKDDVHSSLGLLTHAQNISVPVHVRSELIN